MSSNGSKNEAKSSNSSVKNAWSKPLQPKTPITPPPGMSGKSSSAGATAGATSALSSRATTTASSNAPSSSTIMLTEAQAALRERFVSLTVLAVGQPVTATLTDGTKLEAILHTATPFAVQDEQHRFKYVFKQVNVLEKGTKFQYEKGSTAILDMVNVVNVVIRNLRLDAPSDKASAAATLAASSTAGTGDGFRTDTEISAAAGAGKAKGLEAAGAAWTGGGASSPTMSLTSNGPMSNGRNSRAEALMGKNAGGGGSNSPAPAASSLQGDIGRWDQFKANKTLFNVDATFDENLYTTSLDKSKMDAQQIRQAERLAKEIESQTTSNIHVAEERGMKLETDFDEEDLYSGVIKSGEKASEQSQVSKDDSAAPKMNYAAAAAKQTLPPGFNASGKQPQTPTRCDAKDDTANPTSPAAAQASEASSVKEEKSSRAGEEPKPAAAEPKTEENGAKAAPASKLKLNPNAKAFSLSVAAKPFTPNFGAEQPPVIIQQPQMQYGAFDPGSGMPIPMDPNAMHGHAYLQHGGHMGHPAMMGMAGQQFQGMRYPGQFHAMDAPQQHMVPVAPVPQASHPPQQTGQPVPNSTQASGAASPMTASEDESQPVPEGILDNESVTSSQAPPQIHIQQQLAPQQGMPMPYGAHPAFYGQVPMHPPQHGMPYPPQHYGMTQQVPGGPMYRQGYPMPHQMPQNMIRQAYQYGPGGPVTYQQYGYDETDGFRGGRGRGRGARGMGGRGAGRNNRTNMNVRGQGPRSFSDHQQSGDNSMASQNEGHGSGIATSPVSAGPSHSHDSVPATAAGPASSTQVP